MGMVGLRGWFEMRMHENHSTRKATALAPTSRIPRSAPSSGCRTGEDMHGVRTIHLVIWHIRPCSLHHLQATIAGLQAGQ